MSATTPAGATTPAQIDPRIRARRIEVRRGAGRRRLRWVIVAGALLAIAGGLAAVAYSPLFDVDRVDVRGVGHTDPDAVRAAAGIVDGDPLVSVSLGAAARRVEALPWVASATVRRSVGGDIDIAVVERTAVVAIAQATGVALVDRHGRVLEVVPVTPPGLLTIDGYADELRPGAAVPREARGGLDVARRFSDALAGRATAVVLGDELTVGLHGGAVIRLGDATDLDAKLLAVTTVLTEVDAACLATLDVRLPGNPVLTRAEPCP